MNMIIYKITCLVTNKIYIGQTIRDLQSRFQNHIRDSVVYKVKTKIGRAIRKYGVQEFKIEVIEECQNIDELNKAEAKWISFYNSASKGYNIKTGGKNSPHAKSTIEKISKANKERVWTQEMRQRMSEAIKNSEKCKRKHSEETKEKISKSNKGRKFAPLAKKAFEAYNSLNKIKIICNETQEIFSSVKEAARVMNINDAYLRAHLKGKFTHCKGYTFNCVT